MATQPEQILEDNLVQQLGTLGYAFVTIKDEEELLRNLKLQLERHNDLRMCNCLSSPTGGTPSILPTTKTSRSSRLFTGPTSTTGTSRSWSSLPKPFWKNATSPRCSPNTSCCTRATRRSWVMRPCQYNAVEAILDRVQNSTKNGYIWHTTGSGKTLTSFKAAQILTKMPLGGFCGGPPGPGLSDQQGIQRVFQRQRGQYG